MRYREITPHAVLQDDVRCFWILEQDHPDASTQDVTPDGCVELIFNFGAPYVPLRQKSSAPLPVASIVGFQEKTLTFAVRGTVRIVAARLFPWAAVGLLDIGGDRLANIVTGAMADWDGVTKDLDTLVAAGDYDGAAARLEQVLIERSLATRYDRDIVQAAAKMLHSTQGRYRIEELAEACRLSVRQLERGFKSVLGTTPKAFARTVRFETAERRLWWDPRADLASVAADCGYFDQAHFTKDFKTFAGKTPSEYAAEVLRLHESLKSSDVVFLQSRRARTD